MFIWQVKDQVVTLLPLSVTFIHGLGHLVQGRILGALFYFVAVGVSYALAATVVLAVVFWPLGVILHLICIISAARYKGGD